MSLKPLDHGATTSFFSLTQVFRRNLLFKALASIIFRRHSRLQEALPSPKWDEEALNCRLYVIFRVD